MQRYLTTEPMDADDVAVFVESDDTKSAIDNAHAWVWQFADDPEQAKAQHEQKHAEWEADNEAGRLVKQTY